MTNGADVEIERRFLAREVPSEFTNIEGRIVSDRYIPANADHCYLRIRRDGNNFQITKKILKQDGDLSQMREYTIPLSIVEYDALICLPSKAAVKRRFDHKVEGTKLQIGVFEENLLGLIIVDAEFETVEDSKSFVPPSWFATEVTGDKRFAGGELCGKSIDDLADALRQYGIDIGQTSK
ncbi:MAG: hypothetical protein CFE31_17580 [Rhizobiales bacterium PAR1]|nr:MAG: hypothetical protein CFE31_17580 [Rhizobiales bacterium PAR1]